MMAELTRDTYVFGLKVGLEVFGAGLGYSLQGGDEDLASLLARTLTVHIL